MQRFYQSNTILSTGELLSRIGISKYAWYLDSEIVEIVREKNDPFNDLNIILAEITVRTWIEISPVYLSQHANYIFSECAIVDDFYPPILSNKQASDVHAHFWET